VLLHKAFKKYPRSEWTTVILCEWHDVEGIDLLEVMCIADAKRQPGCLNLADGGTGGKVFKNAPWKGKKLPVDHPFRKGFEKVKRTPEWEAKRIASVRAYKRTPEHQAALNAAAAAKRGEKRGPMSEAQKRKLSDIMKNRVITWGDKISAARRATGSRSRQQQASPPEEDSAG
jgi:hypothetical protein